jgi:hypothetical protein
MLPLELQNVKGALERGRAPLALDCSIVVAPFTTSLVSVLKVGMGASPSPPRTGLRRSRNVGEALKRWIRDCLAFTSPCPTQQAVQAGAWFSSECLADIHPASAR